MLVSSRLGQKDTVTILRATLSHVRDLCTEYDQACLQVRSRIYAATDRKLSFHVTIRKRRLTMRRDVALILK